jgi:SAM-dependent methyltransferase
MGKIPVDEFPLVMTGGRWRRRAKLALGYAAAALMPGRAKALESGEADGRLSSADRLIVGAMVHRAVRQRKPIDQFAYLHQRMWSSDTITAYHAVVEERFTRWFIPHQSMVVDALERELARQPGRFHTLCEIGCGSGLTLDYLSKRLPAAGVRKFIGLDLSPAQVANNSARFSDATCSFVAADACTWIPANAGPGWILFCCGGVLEYLPESVLDGLLAATADGRMAPVRWAIVEPLDGSHDLTEDPVSRLCGMEQSWSHHYPHHLRRAGLTIHYQHDLRFEGTRWQVAIAGT